MGETSSIVRRVEPGVAKVCVCYSRCRYSGNLSKFFRHVQFHLHLPTHFIEPDAQGGDFADPFRIGHLLPIVYGGVASLNHWLTSRYPSEMKNREKRKPAQYRIFNCPALAPSGMLMLTPKMILIPISVLRRVSF